MQCAKCHKQLSNKSALARHNRESCLYRFGIKRVSDNTIPQPSKRQKTSINNPQVGVSGIRTHPLPQPKQLDDGVEMLSSAFKCRIVSYRFSFQEITIDHERFFNNIKAKVLRILVEYLNHFHSLKINWELFSLYVKPETEISDTKSFNTKNLVVTRVENLDAVFEELKELILKKAGGFQMKDSGKLFFICILSFENLFPSYCL